MAGRDIATNTLLLGWLVLGACAAPGVCEIEFAEGQLCYELGENSKRGYREAKCDAPGDGWTGDVTCEDQGYELLCTDNDGYLIYASDEATCCAFGYDCKGACTCPTAASGG